MDDSTQPALEPAQPTQPTPPAQPVPEPVSPSPSAGQPSAWVAPPVRDPLPGSVVGAAVVLLVMGVLTGLLAALFLLSGSIYDQLPDSTFSGLSPEEVDRARDLSRGFVTVFGAIAGVLALGHLASGVGIFRRATWARVIGMVLAGLGIIFTGLLAIVLLIAVSGSLPVTSIEGSGLTPEQTQQAMRAGAVVGLAIFGVGLLAYLFTLVALIRNGRTFES